MLSLRKGAQCPRKCLNLFLAILDDLHDVIKHVVPSEKGAWSSGQLFWAC